MQEELATIIDQVFGEFVFATKTTGACKLQSPQSAMAETGAAEEIDSDWYDVPVDDLPIEEEIQQLDSIPEQLGLESFRNVDRAKGSLLSESATIHGNIQFQNPEVEIHAVVNGNIDMPGDSVLLIGKRAMITGDITCSMISIAGVVVGNIVADQVQILETGSIQGNVTYSTAIGIATGAEICGRIQKEDKTGTRIS